MHDRIATIGPVAAVAGALGLCCGLPVLLWLGVVGAIAGWSLQNWVLIGLGFVLAAVGWARIVRGQRRGKSCHQPGAATPMDALTTQTAAGTADAMKKENHL